MGYIDFSESMGLQQLRVQGSDVRKAHGHLQRYVGSFRGIQASGERERERTKKNLGCQCKPHCLSPLDGVGLGPRCGCKSSGNYDYHAPVQQNGDQ